MKDHEDPGQPENDDHKKQLDPRLANRRDFKPTTKILSYTPKRTADTHSNKIKRYREKILEQLKDGCAPTSIVDLVYQRSANFNSMLPDNSEIALYSDFTQYLRFCAENNQTQVPVKDYTLIAYIDRLQLVKKCKKATIDLHIASIAWWCDYLNMPDPRKSDRMKLKLKTVRTLQRGRPKQAEGMRYEYLERALDVFNPSIPRDCQDVALLFVGFESLCRRSEIVAMKWPDFEVQPNGTGLLHIPTSKADQEDQGEYLHISKNTTELLLGWRSISADSNSRESIFRGIFSNGMIGAALNPGGVNRVYKRIAKRLGLDHTIFSGHSTRVGATHEMLQRNLNMGKIMLAGRWKSIAMLASYAAKINASNTGMTELRALIERENAPTNYMPSQRGDQTLGAEEE